MSIVFDDCDWRPDKVLRSIRPVKSSTEVVHVELDKGDAYLKGMGNPQGDECLAFELVGTRLARCAGLFVPDFAVIIHEGLVLDRISGATVQFGPAFVSRALPGSPGGGEAFLSKLINPFDIPLLVAFDTWLLNADRCPPNDALDPRPNWDNIFFVPISGNRYQLTVFDHTHCFAEAGLEEALLNGEFLDDERVFGVFPEFVEFIDEESLRRSAHTIRNIDAAWIGSVVDSVPSEWDLTSATKAEWTRQIVDRQARLESILMEGLIPQGILELDS